MEINNFIQKFASQFEETNVSDFTPTTAFKELDEWSSLTALSVLAMIYEEYGIKMQGEDIRSSNTIQDLFNCMTLKKN